MPLFTQANNDNMMTTTDFIFSQNSYRDIKSCEMLDLFKVFELDFYITDTEGCRFHVTGWIDVGWGGVNGYDVTMSGPCGNHHFVSGKKENSCENCGMSQEEIEKFVLGLLDQ